MEALIAILPFLLLILLCPLLMFSMHRGQDHHVDEREELARRLRASKDEGGS